MKKILLFVVLSLMAVPSFAMIQTWEIQDFTIRSEDMADSSVKQREIQSNSVGDTQLTTSVEGILYIPFVFNNAVCDTAGIGTNGVLLTGFNPALSADLTVSKVDVIISSSLAKACSVTLSINGNATCDSVPVLINTNTGTLSTFTNFKTITSASTLYIKLIGGDNSAARCFTILIEARYAIKND